MKKDIPGLYEQELFAVRLACSDDRDVHFIGFAALLIPELDEQIGEVTKWAEKRDASKKEIARELYSRWGMIIARRAYDLVGYALDACDQLEAEAGLEQHGFTSDYLLSHIPGMTMWPQDGSGE